MCLDAKLDATSHRAVPLHDLAEEVLKDLEKSVCPLALPVAVLVGLLVQCAAVAAVLAVRDVRAAPAAPAVLAANQIVQAGIVDTHRTVEEIEAAEVEAGRVEVEAAEVVLDLERTQEEALEDVAEDRIAALLEFSVAQAASVRLDSQTVRRVERNFDLAEVVLGVGPLAIAWLVRLVRLVRLADTDLGRSSALRSSDKHTVQDTVRSLKVVQGNRLHELADSTVLESFRHNSAHSSGTRSFAAHTGNAVGSSARSSAAERRSQDTREQMEQTRLYSDTCSISRSHH